ncbi:MAG: hypothetical protein J5737_00200 [Bacteroidales bacterium]|nr:hypothetical protein [Bacteroidales bacterium]
MDKILRFFLLLLPLCSCSVKEDRGLCPCELTVRSSEPLKTEGDVLVSVIQDGSVVRQGMMSRMDFESGNCVLTVPRRPSVVTVFTGITDMNTVSGRRLDILSDHECDELYSCSATAELSADTGECVVTPHKNYARLHLAVLGLPENSDLKVSGPVKGYDLLSLVPCEGMFLCGPRPDDTASNWLLRLPRQVDDSLSMEILNAAGDMLGEVGLGRLIAASGYSYVDEDLMDISVTVDLTRSTAIVHISGWESDSEFSIDY